VRGCRFRYPRADDPSADDEQVEGTGRQPLDRVVAAPPDVLGLERRVSHVREASQDAAASGPRRAERGARAAGRV